MSRELIERARIDLEAEAAPGAVSSVTHLTHAADPRWAGIVDIGPSQTYALDAGSRHDVYVLRGQVEADRRSLDTDDFLIQHGPSILSAGDAGARLFIYREASAGRSEAVVHEARQREWRDGRNPRMRVVALSNSEHHVSLVAWQAGAGTVDHAHPNGEELFVLSGELLCAGARYPAGAWVRLHPGARHQPLAEAPAVILLRHGHLRPASV